MLNFLLAARLAASLPLALKEKIHFHLGFLRQNHKRYAFLAYNFNSLASAKSSESHPQQSQQNCSTTASYLANSCGLSPEVASQVSKRVKLKDPQNSNLVLDLLRNYGFSKTQIPELVKAYPKVLLANPEKTLLPKLKFFQSIGFSCADLRETLLRNPRLMHSSLDKFVIPCYEVLKSVLVDDGKVLTAIKKSGGTFGYSQSLVKNLVPNVEILRELGVPQSSICFLVTYRPAAAFHRHARFVESVKSVKEMGFDPFRVSFIEAVNVFAKTKKLTWELKLRVFERCGWSRDVALSMFRKAPLCMTVSEDKISKTKKFLVDELGWPMEAIAKYPIAFRYSLKQRIIPRCSVIRILQTEGLVRNDLSLDFLKLSEKSFLKRYVIKFQADLPLLLNMYEAQTGLPEVQS